MRKYLLIAAGVAVLAGTGAAMAQMPPGGGPRGPGGPGGPGGPEEHHERWGMMRHMHHREDGAAFFRFRRGDAEMDIKCPAMENVQACVAAAATLMDKVAATNAPKPQ